MAVLDETNRQRVWAQMMRENRFPPGVNKADFRAALDAADNWAEANAASFNAALPQPFRGAATPAEKAMLLAIICSRRAGIYRAVGD